MGNRIQRIAFPYPYPPNRFRTQPEYITNMYGDKIPVLYFPNLQKIADVEHVKEEKVKDQKEKQEVKEEQKGRNKLIIFSHGNATDLAASEEFLRHFGKQFQVSVLGYEYLGYGFSQPVVDNSTSINIQYPCEEGCYESLGMAWNYARKTLGYAAEDIILMGQSIGSGPTCEIAKRVSKKYKKESATFSSTDISNASDLSKESSEEKSEFSNSSNSYKNTPKALGGVILVSPFRTAAKVVTNNPLGYFVDFFCNEQKIHKIDAPILIIHGTSDSVIGCDHSEYMVNKCHESRTKEQQCNSVTLCLIKDADHNDIFFYDEMREAIRNFLDSHIADAN